MKRKYKISTRITLLSFGLVAGTILLLILVLNVQKIRMTPALSKIINQQTREEAGKLSQTLWSACAASEALSTRALDQSLTATRDLLRRQGAISQNAESVAWQAENQFSHQKTTVNLPKMMVGGDWFGQNASARTPSPVVDDAKLFTGAEVTIFQRMNEAGDMLRVCTTVIKADGQRAVGTYI
ncbi:MAG TPA: Cache 3/Cache 2 fusion domain-containing protein, partial [Candidatus Paceibacterota bacterium]|nr:Cache 3/Cache 2 fusion domain-containing protein [Candidatus Paceibacterota bacterium]